MLFAIVLGLTVGLLFHSVFGRRLWQLPCYVVSALVGAVAGQVVSVMSGIEHVMIGNTPLVMALIGTLLMLGLCWFFTAPIESGSSRARRRARRMVSRQERASA